MQMGYPQEKLIHGRPLIMSNWGESSTYIENILWDITFARQFALEHVKSYLYDEMQSCMCRKKELEDAINYIGDKAA